MENKTLYGADDGLLVPDDLAQRDRCQARAIGNWKRLTEGRGFYSRTLMPSVFILR
jgi:hypothetical protein